MRFWDSSALVPLLVNQTTSAAMTSLYQEDENQLVWWLSELECRSALARLDRDGSFAPAPGSECALSRLDRLRERWHEIPPTTEVREVAGRFVRVHALRTANALQLSAAHLGAERRPETLEFVCLDCRLSEVARLEGFVCRP